MEQTAGKAITQKENDREIKSLLKEHRLQRANDEETKRGDVQNNLTNEISLAPQDLDENQSLTDVMKNLTEMMERSKIIDDHFHIIGDLSQNLEKELPKLKFKAMDVDNVIEAFAKYSVSDIPHDVRQTIQETISRNEKTWKCIRQIEKMIEQMKSKTQTVSIGNPTEEVAE